MKKPDVDSVAKEIHETATKSGFWDEDRNTGEMLMLVISELAESLEEHRDGNPNMYKNYLGKPEGIVVELADAAIRILDTLYNKWEYPKYGLMAEAFLQEYNKQTSEPKHLTTIGDNFGENLLKASVLVTRASTNFFWLVTAFIFIERLVKERGYNIWPVMDEKTAYNKSRAYKHGRAY